MVVSFEWKNEDFPIVDQEEPNGTYSKYWKYLKKELKVE